MDNFILGSIDSPCDPRDYTYSDLCMATSTSTIPSEFELDWSAYEILSQGSVGSCKAFALSMIKTYIDGNYFNDRYSVGWIYGNRYDTDHQGSGLISRQTLKHLVNEGVCLHNDFPVNIEYPEIKETIEEYGEDALLEKASEHKSLSYIRLSSDEIKSYLVNYQKPILIDVYVYENFYNANSNNGLIPSVPTGSKLGGHSMIIIGFKGDILTLVNSWGSNKGDSGFYYLDLNSTIIKELWVLEDTLNVNRPDVSGWVKVDEVYPGGTRVKWKYRKTDGTYCCNEWLQLGDNWFRFGEDSYALYNSWYRENGYWYYLDSNCYMVTGWLLEGGNYYYFYPETGKPKGSMAVSTIIDGKYKVDANGCWDWITL